MANYVIGDVQGCYNALLELLEKINFNHYSDTLFFAGDIVNRGKQSLDTIRFIKKLGNRAQIVLGNHDLYLLSCAYNYVDYTTKDTFTDILEAKDHIDIIEWLRHQPLLVIKNNHVLTHAGIPSIWSVKKARKRAEELETILRSDICSHIFLSQMYGDLPDIWNKYLEGVSRWRCILSYFTRMRLTNKNGRLNLQYKGSVADAPKEWQPWFNFKNKIKPKYTILFGHWAALNGITGKENILCLDTGCVWGGKLTAYCMETRKTYTISAKSLSVN